MTKYILIACLLLAGCAETKCIDNRVAFKQQGYWVIQNDAYRCEKDTP